MAGKNRHEHDEHFWLVKILHITIMITSSYYPPPPFKFEIQTTGRTVTPYSISPESAGLFNRKISNAAWLKRFGHPPQVGCVRVLWRTTRDWLWWTLFLQRYLPSNSRKRIGKGGGGGGGEGGVGLRCNNTEGEVNQLCTVLILIRVVYYIYVLYVLYGWQGGILRIRGEV